MSDATIHPALPSEGPLAEASQPFVGRWNRLVSTTNWEKGRIISEWRAALIAAGAAAAEYSDEAWSLRVGQITGQHVGRLRRVCERFGGNQKTYRGLFWSHFQAALDWDDAEMWLEGAMLNDWSVARMRTTRWESLHPGGESPLPPEPADQQPSEDDTSAEPANTPRTFSEAATGPTHEGPDFGDEAAGGSRGGEHGDDGAAIYAETAPVKPVSFVQPFANLAALPDDLAEAFENFKLAILRHKADDWRQIAREDVLATLDALKELALAPAVDSPAF